MTCKIKNFFYYSFLTDICIEVHWTQIWDVFKTLVLVQYNVIFVKRKKRVVFPYGDLI